MARRVAARWVSAHRQVTVKVNASVDEGVSEVVRVLSTIPSIQTKSSCQGDPNSYLEVLFIYDSEPAQAVRFMNRLRLIDFPEVHVMALPHSDERLVIRMKAPNAEPFEFLQVLSEFAGAWNLSGEAFPNMTT